jgi:hypothetical protein
MKRQDHKVFEGEVGSSSSGGRILVKGKNDSHEHSTWVPCADVLRLRFPVPIAD